jgi:hypothetical protein
MDAVIADQAVKLKRMEDLLAARQAQVQRLSEAGREWRDQAQTLSHAVDNTISAISARLPAIFSLWLPHKAWQ